MNDIDQWIALGGRTWMRVNADVFSWEEPGFPTGTVRFTAYKDEVTLFPAEMVEFGEAHRILVMYPPLEPGGQPVTQWEPLLIHDHPFSPPVVRPAAFCPTLQQAEVALFERLDALDRDVRAHQQAMTELSWAGAPDG